MKKNCKFSVGGLVGFLLSFLGIQKTVASISVSLRFQPILQDFLRSVAPIFENTCK